MTTTHGVILNNCDLFGLCLELERNLAVEAELWETHDTETTDGHLLHTQGCNSLPRTCLMTILSSEMTVISPESELQLCTDSVGDYYQSLS